MRSAVQLWTMVLSCYRLHLNILFWQGNVYHILTNIFMKLLYAILTSVGPMTSIQWKYISDYPDTYILQILASGYWSMSLISRPTRPLLILLSNLLLKMLFYCDHNGRHANWVIRELYFHWTSSIYRACDDEETQWLDWGARDRRAGGWRLSHPWEG